MMVQHLHEIPPPWIVFENARRWLLQHDASIEANDNHHQENCPWVMNGYPFESMVCKAKHGNQDIHSKPAFVIQEKHVWNHLYCIQRSDFPSNWSPERSCIQYCQQHSKLIYLMSLHSLQRLNCISNRNGTATPLRSCLEALLPKPSLATR